jgi:hypothetical protein
VPGLRIGFGSRKPCSRPGHWRRYRMQRGPCVVQTPWSADRFRSLRGLIANRLRSCVTCQPLLDTQSTISSACLPSHVGLNLALRQRVESRSSANQRSPSEQVIGRLARYQMVVQISTDQKVKRPGPSGPFWLLGTGWRSSSYLSFRSHRHRAAVVQTRATRMARMMSQPAVVARALRGFLPATPARTAPSAVTAPAIRRPIAGQLRGRRRCACRARL